MTAVEPRNVTTTHLSDKFTTVYSKCIECDDPIVESRPRGTWAAPRTRCYLCLCKWWMRKLRGEE